MTNEPRSRSETMQWERLVTRHRMLSRVLQTHVLVTLLLLILMISLAGCGSVTAILKPRPVVRVTTKTQDRLGLIRSQLKEICPNPLTNLQRERAAVYVTEHPDAFPIVSDLDRLDNAAVLCRLGPQQG